ncbi:hypothetical protein BC332_18441 [Capsicum chinense]|nr:hypothetical protein BC332_18441 [Capsicum chinense]
MCVSDMADPIWDIAILHDTMQELQRVHDMNNSDREWMYNRLLEDGFINPRFIDGVESFVEIDKSHPEFTTHLGNNGFVPNYYHWHHHGEGYIPNSSVLDNHQEEASASGETVNSQSYNEFQNMVFDVARHSYDGNIEEDPNPITQNLYNLLKVSKQKIQPGNPYGHTQLSVVARLLNLKAEHHFSKILYDELCQFISELMPTDNMMIDSFYSTKKLMRELGLPVEKIDDCKNYCMLYWREGNGRDEDENIDNDKDEDDDEDKDENKDGDKDEDKDDDDDDEEECELHKKKREKTNF